MPSPAVLDAPRPPVVFDAATHTYTVAGVVWPSVTGILRDVGLIKGDWYTEWARERGTAVHHWLRMVDLLLCAVDDVPERWRPYVRQWIAFRDREVTEIHVNEEPLANHGLQFCGTPDRVVTYRRFPTIFDFKTGYPEQWHATQTALYSLLLPDPWRYRRGALYLDGSEKPARLVMHEEKSDLDVARAAVTVSCAIRRRNK